MDEKEMQEKYIELQSLEQQMAQVQKYLQLMDNQIIELTTTNKALDDLKDVKPNTNILVPISNGIFAKAEIKDSKELIVNVGANVTVKKDVKSTKDLIEKQIDEIKSNYGQINSEMQKLGVKASAIEKELQEIISKKE